MLRGQARVIFFVLTALASLSINASVARAHCDTMDGPVVTAAQAALAKGDVTPVLKWVKSEHEAEIRAAFDRALAVRKLSPEAKELADRYFFETLVRVHREGEGAPYEGLKPAGSEVSPAILGADRALEEGSVDSLAKMVSKDVEAGIRERFVRAQELKAKSETSVDAGRDFVAAYVEFIHYVERVHAVATGSASAHGEGHAGHAAK